MTDFADASKRALIHRRRVEIDHVGDRNTPVAFCPRTLTVLPVEDCRHCERFGGLCVNPSEGAMFLRCAFGEDEPMGPAASGESAAQLALAACRSPVAEAMQPCTSLALAQELLGCSDASLVENALTVTPETTVSQTAALMAYEGAHHVVVRMPDGVLLGVLSCLDVARWIARADGYVVPRRASNVR